MGNPLVSVLMPVYNEELYVRTALDSILAQTYKNYEVIIINDASEDGTAEMVKPHLNKCVKMISMIRNLGKAVCLNWGLTMANGRYILEMDGDDWLEPEALEVLVKEGERLPEEVAYIYSDRRVYYQDRKGRLKFHHVSKGVSFIDRYRFLSTLRAYGPRFIRKKVLSSIGGWPVDYPTRGRLFEDFALVLKLLDQYKFSYVPRCLYNIRRHGENISKVNKKLWWPVCKVVVDEALIRWGGEYRAVITNKRSKFRLLRNYDQTGS
ncbi:MAG: glycosyltransferase family 2 protein [Clostridia bacterium]|nr:glycosyltransferase family 2 protein [Clostridia bacterium]